MKEQVIDIRYSSIRSIDISNGEGVGVALFVQGCHFHCYNCFNIETWDFSGGKEWTSEVKGEFLELIDRSYIKRVSILGGEPLAEENLDGVLKLINQIRLSTHYKSIWLYSGYTWDDIWCNCSALREDHGLDFSERVLEDDEKRQKIVAQCDIFVDGKYIDSQHDFTLKWRGSKNQRVIDVRRTLREHKIKLLENT